MSDFSYVLLILAAASYVVFLAQAALITAAARNPARTQAFNIQYNYLGMAVGFSIIAVLVR